MWEPDPERDQRRKDIQERLFQSPALFGRLLAAAELHNPASRRYEHYLCRDFPDDGDSILRQMHVEVFAGWLNFRLKQQKEDRISFLEFRSGQHFSSLIDCCYDMAPYQQRLNRGDR